MATVPSSFLSLEDSVQSKKEVESKYAFFSLSSFIKKDKFYPETPAAFPLSFVSQDWITCLYLNLSLAKRIWPVVIQPGNWTHGWKRKQPWHRKTSVPATHKKVSSWKMLMISTINFNSVWLLLHLFNEQDQRIYLSLFYHDHMLMSGFIEMTEGFPEEPLIYSPLLSFFMFLGQYYF